MIALHPPLSGFPLAFVSLLIGIEALRYSRLSNALPNLRLVLVLATCVASLGAFFSGYQAVSDLGAVPEAIEKEISTHHVVGRFLVFNSALLAGSFWLSRIAIHARVIFSAAYYAFISIQLFLTLYAGYLGGALVFVHGVGVK